MSSRVAVGERCVPFQLGQTTGHLTLGGDVLTIEGESGATFRFEWHEYFVPSRVGKNGDILAQPFFPERSKFWPLFERWLRGGKRVDEENRCILPPAERRVTCDACHGCGYTQARERARKFACRKCGGAGSVEVTP